MPVELTPDQQQRMLQHVERMAEHATASGKINVLEIIARAYVRTMMEDAINEWGACDILRQDFWTPD